MTPEMTRELTATGGALVVGLGLGILLIQSVRVGSLLPAPLVIKVLTAALPHLGGVGRALGL